MGWANRITIARCLLMLAVWILLLWGGDSTHLRWPAFILFVIAAVTDFVDGYVARTLGEVTLLGRVLDPLADKLLTLGTMVLLLTFPSVHALMPAWMVAVMLARELTVTSVRSVVEAQGGDFGAISIGKTKATLQSIATGGAIALPLDWEWGYREIPFLSWLPDSTSPWNLAHVVVWVTLLVTVYSGWIYVVRGKRALADLRA